MTTTRVFIIDDSAVVRQGLTEIFASDPELEVCGAAQDPIIAAQKLRDVCPPPDVLTLDLEMPRMDGLTFLSKLMTQHPMPVVVCSTLTETNSEIALRALEMGAVDVLQKPKLGTRAFLHESRVRLCDAVKAAALAGRKGLRAPELPRIVKPEVDTAHAMPLQGVGRTTDKVIALGASTGGTEALATVLVEMPLDCPGIVVVQHMPEHFTRAFAMRLDGLCRIAVREARDGDAVLRGQALIAPGNQHMLLKRSGARYHVELRDGPFVSRHRPSVDVLFRSAARYVGANCLAAILTGMGDDGAKGILELKQSGAATLAQSEASCVVFGMPKEAIRRGGVDKAVDLSAIAPELLALA